jgi:hypothetical protein
MENNGAKLRRKDEMAKRIGKFIAYLSANLLHIIMTVPLGSHFRGLVFPQKTCRPASLRATR